MEARSKHTKQRGHIFLWRYDGGIEKYRHWNLSADDEGCASMIEICDELKSDRVRYRTLRVSAPTVNILMVPNYPRQMRWYAPQRLRIENLRENVGKPSFELDEKDGTIFLRLDIPSLEGLQSAFREIMAGKGDYWVEIGGEKVWLWWHLSD